MIDYFAAVRLSRQQARDSALELLQENKSKLDALVEALLAKNHLNLREIEQILKDH